MLNETIKEQTEKIKNQNLAIDGYKKIFKKEFAIALKLKQINSVDTNRFINLDIKKINEVLNCHINNFKNLDASCTE